MTKLTKILANKGTQNTCFCGIFVILATLFIGNAECASSRGTVARRTQTVARTQPVKKQNDIKTTETLRSDTLLDEGQQEEDDSDNTTKKQPIAVKKPKADTVPEPEPVIEEQEIIVEDKTSLFDDVLGDATSNNGDTSRTSLAEQIRAQRAALDAADAAATASANTKSALATGKNTCDQNLRACMKSKCGNDFSKCAGDTDTTWGDKMDACRRDLPCSGEEYRLFATEIKADRDLNAQVAAYNSIVSCGNRYNDCIITECGTQFTKCLGKSAGDSAISKCAKIAKECQEQDSGLASRAMSVFGTLRQDAEKTVKTDEEKLYSMRDAMRNTCERLGAMFDERSLDCVYTINFYAGEDNTLFASKKAYAGSTFNCHQDWFGIDVTTFKENAFRLTRAQKAASSAMLGGGLGTAVGAVTSGALDRSIERQKAEQRAKNGGKTDAEMRKDKRDEKKKAKETDRDAKKKEKANKKEAAAATDINAEAADANAAAATTEADAEEANAAATTTEADANAAAATTTTEAETTVTEEDAEEEVTVASDATDNNRNQGSEQQQNSKRNRNNRLKKQCENSHGKWDDNNTCECAEDKNLVQNGTNKCKCKNGHRWNDAEGKCVQTAGAQNRAERETEKHAEAKQKCIGAGGEWQDEENTCKCPKGKEWEQNECRWRGDTNAASCERTGGTWEGNKDGQYCPRTAAPCCKCGDNMESDKVYHICIKCTKDQNWDPKLRKCTEKSPPQQRCEEARGTWDLTTGKCNNPKCGRNKEWRYNECVTIQQNTPAQTNAPAQTQEQINEQINEQIRNTAYDAPVPIETKINTCRNGKSYTIKAGQSPKAAGVPRDCWEEAKKFVGVNIS